MLRCSYCNRAAVSNPGFCPACGLADTYGAAQSIGPRPDAVTRTCFQGFNDMLTGGLRPGVVLLSGAPGIGKSTFSAQIAASVPGSIYVTTEEDAAAVERLAARVAPGRKLHAVRETDGAEAIKHAAKARLLVVDSLNGLGGESHAATLVILRGLIDVAAHFRLPVIALSHVNKQGEPLGLRSVEHAVNAVLRFTGEPTDSARFVVPSKIRGAPTVGVSLRLEMSDRGLTERGAFDAILDARTAPQIGATLALLNGPRGLTLATVEALATAGPPQVHAAGIEAARVKRLLQILGASLGVAELLSRVSVSVDVSDAGEDPQADAAVCCAVLSSLLALPISPVAVVCGAVSLSGAIRGDALADRRRAALARTRGVLLGPPADRTLAEVVGALKLSPGERRSAPSAVPTDAPSVEPDIWARLRA